MKRRRASARAPWFLPILCVYLLNRKGEEPNYAVGRTQNSQLAKRRIRSLQGAEGNTPTSHARSVRCISPCSNKLKAFEDHKVTKVRSEERMTRGPHIAGHQSYTKGCKSATNVRNLFCGILVSAADPSESSSWRHAGAARGRRPAE